MKDPSTRTPKGPAEPKREGHSIDREAVLNLQIHCFYSFADIVAWSAWEIHSGQAGDGTTNSRRL